MGGERGFRWVIGVEGDGGIAFGACKGRGRAVTPLGSGFVAGGIVC